MKFREYVSCTEKAGIGVLRKCSGLHENKLHDDLYRYRLEGIKGLDGDVYIRVIKDPYQGRPIFNVYYQGNKIASFKMSGQGNYISDADVLLPYRRKGIATKVYDFIEDYLNIKIMQSPMYQTQNGKDFWKARIKKII